MIEAMPSGASEFLAGANMYLMTGVAFLAGILRWTLVFKKREAILIPLFVGSVLGCAALDTYTVEKVAGAIMCNGVAAVFLSRAMYSGIALFLDNTERSQS